MLAGVRGQISGIRYQGIAWNGPLNEAQDTENGVGVLARAGSVGVTSGCVVALLPRERVDDLNGRVTGDDALFHDLVFG
jgi:hypothetical protein